MSEVCDMYGKCVECMENVCAICGVYGKFVKCMEMCVKCSVRNVHAL